MFIVNSVGDLASLVLGWLFACLLVGLFCVCVGLIRIVRLCLTAGGVLGFWWLFVNIVWFVVLVSCLGLVD